jgi:endoglucanase
MKSLFLKAFLATALCVWAIAAPAAPRVGGVIAGSPLWSDWNARFLAPSGRVIDTGNHEISHSEGQGYGMLLAVAAKDRAAFDRMWTWTAANLQIRSDRLLAWRWDPAHNAVTDYNNATDGDILVAWALAEAADLWNAPDYAKAGAGIAGDISRKLIVERPDLGPALLPAAFGFASGDQSDGPVVNLSYWVFPAFDRLSQLAPDRDWDAVRRTGLALVDKVQAKSFGAPPDWISLAHNVPAPARRYPARSSYDAMRVPLYLGITGNDHRNRLLASDRAVPSLPDGLAIVDLATGAADGVATGRGYRAIGALRACATSAQQLPREFYGLSKTDSYYPATLHMLAIVGALTSHESCLDQQAAGAIRPTDWRVREAALPEQARPAAAAPIRRIAQALGPRAAEAAPLPVEASMVPMTPAQDGYYLGGAVALAGLLSLFGWRWSSRQRAEELAGIMNPEARTQPAEQQPERSLAPRCLPTNPFQQARGAEALEQRIEIAAAASAQWQRTVGVAYFRIAGLDDNPAERDRAIEEIAQALRSKIRQSDAVVVIAPGELAVCLSLVADERDLLSIAQRLSNAACLIWRPKEECAHMFGLALYPKKHGCGADCVEAARRDFHDRRPWFDFAPRPMRPKRTRRAKTATSASAAKA